MYDYAPEKRKVAENLAEYLETCMRNRVISESFSEVIISLTKAEEIFALLKEQEGRILDLDELENWDNAVWFEDKDEQDCYIALIANVGTYDATFVNGEPGKFHRLDFLREFYKNEWRCWTAKPTDEQRKAVKWE